MSWAIKNKATGHIITEPLGRYDCEQLLKKFKPGHCEIVEVPEPVSKPKAIKDDTESLFK
jgi:hypothetical protein